MKKVFCPEQKKVIMIDEKKEPKWQTKYRHNSGKPFAWAEEKKAKEKEKKEAKEETLDMLDMESLHKLYEKQLGKKVAPRYKNDKNRIISKLV